MTDHEKPDETMIEEDHPQTRKAEPNARGSAAWNEDVVRGGGEDRERESGRPTVEELAEEAEDTRRKAVGDETAGETLGSDKASGE